MDERSVAGTVAARLGEAFVDLDPGGLRAALAIKAVVGTAAAVAVTVLFARAIPGLAPPAPLAGIPGFADAFRAAQGAQDLVFRLPMVAAVMTLNFFLLVPSASFGRELKWFAIIGLIAVAIVSAVGLAGPGSWGHGELPVAVIWMGLVMAGLYARRWGPVAAKLGILTAVLGIVFVLTNPTHALGFWFPAVAVIALSTAAVVRFLTLRPSAVAAFRVRANRFLAAVADELGAFREGAAPARGSETALRRRWLGLERALTAASAETPRLGPRLTAQLVAAYRIVLAYDVALDAHRALSADERARFLADPRLKGALERLRERLDHPLAIAFPSEATLDPELTALIEELGRPGHGFTADRLQEMRLCVGLRRIERALNDFLAGRSQVEMAPLPDPGAAPGRADPDAAARTAGRLAVQALIATGVTTWLQFAFHLDHAYWATLTVALVLNGTVGETLVRTVKRGLGTLAGVVLAIALLPVFATLPAIELALMLAALFLTVLTLERNYAVASGALGFLVALAIHLLDGASPAEMAARAYETFIGAGAALAVAWIFFPKYAAEGVDARVADFLERVRAGLGEVVRRSGEREETVSVPLAAELRALADDIPNIAAERRLEGRPTAELGTLFVLVDALVNYLGQYESTSGIVDAREVPQEVRERLAVLDRRLEAAMDGLVALARGGAKAAREAGERPVLFEPPGVTTSEIAAAGHLKPRTMLRVVDHAYAGNRIGRTVNDLAAALVRLSRG